MRRGLVLVLALLLTALLTGGCGILGRFSHTLTQRTFTQAVADHLKAAIPGEKVTVVRNLQLRLPGRADVISLQEPWSAYQAGGDPALLIDRFVSYLTEPRPPIPLSWAEAKSRIVPLLIDQLPPAPPGGLVVIPWEAGLKVVLALDGSQGFVNLIPADLENWGLTRQQLYATALENLRERTQTEPMRRARVTDIQGLYLYLWEAGDGLDASRLLLVDEWRQRLLPYITWDMVVIIPSRDQLIAFDGINRDWVKTLKDYAHRKFSDAPFPVSDQLFAFHEGHLVQYKP